MLKPTSTTTTFSTHLGTRAVTTTFLTKMTSSHLSEIVQTKIKVKTKALMIFSKQQTEESNKSQNRHHRNHMFHHILPIRARMHLLKLMAWKVATLPQKLSQVSAKQLSFRDTCLMLININRFSWQALKTSKRSSSMHYGHFIQIISRSNSYKIIKSSWSRLGTTKINSNIASSLPITLKQ